MLRNDLLFGAKAAAEYTGLTRRSIYHLVEKRKIPHGHIGIRIFFRKTELDLHFSGRLSTVEHRHDNDGEG